MSRCMFDKTSKMVSAFRVVGPHIGMRVVSVKSAKRNEVRTCENNLYVWSVPVGVVVEPKVEVWL
jgi:hypothetical protein